MKLPLYHLRWCPQYLLRLLVLKHFVEQWNHPVLELAIVIVGHQKVADTIDALLAQFLAGQFERTDISWSQAFDEVLFDSTSCCHNTIHLQGMLFVIIYKKRNIMNLVILPFCVELESESFL